MRQHLFPWLRRLLIAVIILFLGGVVYQRIAAAMDTAKFPPPGQMIDVGGHRLHLHCVGDGEPTLIIDTGAADWSLSWLALQQDLAALTRTCVYDRAGLGWSEPGPSPRTSEQLVTELHTLLTNAHIEPPYILLGHSLGGYNVRLFNARFPGEAAGLILVESAHEDQWRRLPLEVQILLEQQVGLLRTGTMLSNVGVARFILPDHPYLSGEQQLIYRAHMARGRHLAASADEFDGGLVSAEQAGAAGELGDVPLVVITAGRSFDAFRPLTDQLPFEEAELVWQKLQLELTTLSGNSVHLISQEADHNIHLTDPALVLEGVRWMLAMIKT